MGFFAHQIVGKEKRYFRMESHFVQDERNQLMVKQWEKLGDIKCQCTCLEILDLSRVSKINKKDSSICRQSLFESSKLFAIE